MAEILEEIPSGANGGHLIVKTVEKVRELFLCRDVKNWLRKCACCSCCLQWATKTSKSAAHPDV